MKNIFGVVSQLYAFLLNVLISLIYSKIGTKFRVSRKILQDKSVAVVMNGPTLRSDMLNLQRSEKDLSYICANHLADTDLFSELKPIVYVFSDPYFYNEETSDELVNARNTTFKNIMAKCSWPMIVVMPNKESLEMFSKIFEENHQITVCWFNGSGFPSDYNAALGFMWERGLCAPPGNVLVQSLYLCGFMSAKKIFLLGANWSFHTNIFVDQETNEFYKVREHVYGTSKELSYTCHRKIKKANLEHEFKSLYIGFRELRAVGDYLIQKQVRVVNYTQKSFIDVFSRPDETNENT